MPCAKERSTFLVVSGTLTIQEQGSVSGSIEYENLHIKLGGKIKGDVKVSEKIKNIDDIKKINKEKSLPLQSSLDNKNN